MDRVGGKKINGEAFRIVKEDAKKAQNNHVWICIKNLKEKILKNYV